jgi:hypothetical protein
MALDSGLCFAHDPDNRERATAARRKGGANRSTARRVQKRMPREVYDIVLLVEGAMGAVLKSTVTPSQGHAVASLASCWVRLHELGEFTQRLEALEAAADGGKGTLAGLVSTYRRPS